MQTFTKKTLVQSVLVGTLLAASLVAVVVARAQLKQTEAELAQLTQAEADLARLKTDLARWQRALRAHAEVTWRQEPLDLQVELPPERLQALPPILNKVFDPEGYFLLKQFKFEWKTRAVGAGVGTGTAAAAGAAEAALAPKLARISLQGDRTLILKITGVKP